MVALALAALLIVVAACQGPVSLDHEVTDTWSGGYSASLLVTNTTEEPIEDWRLGVTLVDEITTVWNADLVATAPAAPDGWRYTFAGPSWQPDLPAGATIEIGWVAMPAGNAPATLTDCRLGDRPVRCDTSSTTPTTAPPTTGAPSTSTSTTSTPQPPDPGTVPFAPYLDTTLWPPPDLDALAAAHGLDALTLAFVVTGDTPCAPAWGGLVPLADDHLGVEIDQLRSAGGDVVVSFGGANGTELAQSCPSVDTLVSAYAATIDQYDATAIDLDIEGSALGDVAATQRRSAALAALQAQAAAADRTLAISLTLPVTPQGLTPAGVAVVASALDAGVDLERINIMAMDYGPAAAPNPDGEMGRYAIDAATATHGQLAALMPTRSDAQVWSMIGITPMIGQNDVAGEVFDETDAEEVVAFATEVDLGQLSMWSLTRDVACPGGPSPWASATCSGIDQSPGAFSSILGGS